MAEAQQSLIEEFEEAIASKDAGDRADALGRITALFAAGATSYNDEQVALFDDVMTRLVEQIDVTMRAAFGKRLAALPDAPPKTIRTLASDDSIAVAGPVLARSQRLDDAALVETASTKSQDHLLAISQRRELGAAVTDVLVERGNRDVALSVAQNAGAKFSETGYVRLVKRSEHDDELARSVGSRPEIPRHHFVKLLSTASKAVRIALEGAHPEHAAEIKHVVAKVATEIQAKAAAHSRDYAAVHERVEALRSSGRLGESHIAAFAQAGKFEDTAVVLAMLSTLPIDVVERVLVHDRVETILIIAKAMDLSWPTVRALLVLRTGKGNLSSQDLEQHMANFMRLKRATALQTIEFLRKRQAADNAPHR
jgi:uncharacterized protein (DUF2336 family)